MMKNWSRTHSMLIIALAGVVFLHMKSAATWAEFTSPASLGEIGSQILVTLTAMLTGSPLSRVAWSPEERTERLKPEL